MLCERCNKNVATVQVLKIVNGSKKQIVLCEKCAKIISNVKLTEVCEDLDDIGFKKFINDLISFFSNSEKSNALMDIKCSNCNTSYSDYKAKGILGCSKCYEVFYNYIVAEIEKLNIDIKYNGKFPKRYGKYIFEKRRIEELKDELKKAVKLEQYEYAAEIRDEIKKLHVIIEKEREINGK